MTHRVEQLQSTLQRALQEVLGQGLSDPRADGTMFTVTEIQLSRDLRNATVMVSIFPEAKQELAMHAIRAAGRFIRREAGEKMSLSQLPELAFKLDLRLKQQAEVMRAINEAKQATAGSAGAAASGSPAHGGSAHSDPTETTSQTPPAPQPTGWKKRPTTES